MSEEKPKFTFSFAAPAVEGAEDTTKVVEKEWTETEKTTIAALETLDEKVVARLEAFRKAQEALAKEFEADLLPLEKEREKILSATPLSNFWVNALEAHPNLALRMEDWDMAALGHLTGIQCRDVVGETGEGEPCAGFSVTFSFGPDRHFKNETLTKSFFFESDYPGVELVRTEGTVIEWNSPELNATQEMVEKQVPVGKQGRARGGRRGGRGGRAAGGKTKTVVEAEPRASFFRFFEDVINTDETDPEELDEEEMEMVRDMESGNFETGCLIRNKIWLHAVQWFTGKGHETLSADLKELVDTYKAMQGEKPSFREFMDAQNAMWGGEDSDEDDLEGMDMNALMRQGAAMAPGEKPAECQNQQQ